MKNMNELDKAAWKGFLLGVLIAVAVVSPLLTLAIKALLLKFFYIY
jgi:hypothetical protein